MCVHVFGNSPSPAVATYGLRKTVQNSQEDVKEFVRKNFYVDDTITCLGCIEYIIHASDAILLATLPAILLDVDACISRNF